MTEHKEILKQIAKKKAALARQQQEAIQVSEYCIAEIKRLEKCEKLLNAGADIDGDVVTTIA